MPSTSGLSRDQRIRCRDRVVQAATLAVARRDEMHFDWGSVRRWDGISNHRDASLGQLPNFADCSSFVTWCLWNGLLLRFGLGDVVNGCGWMGGYTGTMQEHGRPVEHAANALRGDCVLYGSGPTPEQVTVVVAVKDGVPMVVSQGSEAGPFYLRYDYRGDILSIRRYI